VKRDIYFSNLRKRKAVKEAHNGQGKKKKKKKKACDLPVNNVLVDFPVPTSLKGR